MHIRIFLHVAVALASCNANDFAYSGPVSISARRANQSDNHDSPHVQEPSLMTQTLGQLENRDAFIERHIGPDARQQQEMLNTVGADSLNDLIGQIVPQDIQLATPPQVGEATTEFAALAELKAIAGRNKRFKSYIGMGYTAVQLPPVIQRNMLENPGWYTAYTPYQPEVSQGRLESLLNFQQVTLDLTGLDIVRIHLHP